MFNKNRVKQGLIISLGTFITSIGLYFFTMPSNLTVGGISGFALSMNHFFPNIPIGIFMMGTDIILFVLSFILIGKEFGGFTIYSSILLSSIITLMEYILPNFTPLTDDILLNMMVGIVITALGISVVINQGASTGGTDIIAKILHKYLHMEISKGILFADLFVVALGVVAFSPEIGMYAFIGILLNSVVVDKVLIGLNIKVEMTIISKENEKINKYIIDELGRGTTIYDGLGGFSFEERKVIYTVVPKSHYIKIKEFIKEVDENAFVSIAYVNEVVGEGFTYELDDFE